MRRSFIGSITALSTPVLLAATMASGGAIDVPQQGARGSAQAEAFAAQADDASAIFYNPAGLTQLHGTSITEGATLFLPDWQFHGANGQHQDMQLLSLLPHGYGETDLGTEKWRFGVGVNNVFGLNEDWGNKGPLNALIEHSHLYTINFAPTVAYQINDNLSIGTAVNIYYGDLELSRAAAVAPPPASEGTFHFRGEDYAFGATPGLMWKIDDRNTLAAVYRSPFKMAFSGEARVKTAGQPELGPSHAHADLNFPQMATLAYAMRPIQPLKIEADVVWTDWDVAKDIALYSPDPRFRMKVANNWRSGFQYRLGTQYDLTRNWALRAGYAYGQNAVPSSTYSPLVPDSNYHLFSVGVGYSKDNWSIDAGYQFIYREQRHINNSVYGSLVNGTWDNQFNELMVSFSLRL
jgi:long-chain fatty acid transport protein